MELVIVPVAHVSKRSIEKVRETILNEKPNAIAVELCESRLRAMLEKSNRIRGSDIVRNPLYFGFYAFQRALGGIFKVKPGSEMLEAVSLAKELNLPLYLVDRDIRETMKKIGSIPLKEKLMLLFQGPLSLPAWILRAPKNIDQMTTQDFLGKFMPEFRNAFPNFYRVLVSERNEYMASKINQLDTETVVLVVGAGHVSGIIPLVTATVRVIE